MVFMVTRWMEHREAEVKLIGVVSNSYIVFYDFKIIYYYRKKYIGGIFKY